MSYFIVDVESDGPVPSLYSMVCFGAVLVDDALDKTFYGETKPISQEWQEEALAISGINRHEHLAFDYPGDVMLSFEKWIKENSKGKPIFISDNNGYDWQFINYYFHAYLGSNPFGYSSRRLSDLFCGFYKKERYQWKHHRKTTHTHNPVDDAKGNAEALLYLRDQGLDIKLK